MTSHAALPLAASAMQWVMGNIDWAVAALIVVVCLVIYGGKDLLRFSPLRARAVASVCFHESIRRRVLWLTPLAILAVILVSQFQRPLDDQDAIRQTTRFCVFAAGVLVTVAAIILACTNLPREIENRVIYTVVTKPTSRLEILVGKIVGFSTLSALILAIMGVFSWGYLHWQEWRLLQGIQTQLAANITDTAAEQTLKYYADHGLLNARDYRGTVDVQVMAEYPKPDATIRWASGGGEQEILVPFRLDPAQVQAASEAGMLLAISMPWEEFREPTLEEMQGIAMIAESAHVQTTSAAAPQGPGMSDALKEKYPGFVRVAFYSAMITDPIELEGSRPIPLFDASGRKRELVEIPAATARQAVAAGQFFVAVSGVNPNVRFGVQGAPVALLLPSADPKNPTLVTSQPIRSGFGVQVPIIGRSGMDGQQLRGDKPEAAPIAVFAYRSRDLAARSGDLNIEFRTVVDRQGSDDAIERQQPTLVELSVLNKNTNKASTPVTIAVESRRTAYATLPAEYVAGGHFDVLVRSLTPGHWIGLTPQTVRLAVGDGSFALNLAKSYLILWMLSVLVILVAIFSSTFLSWPIAVVLTAVILLGHWGVMQLGEMTAPGVGRQVVNDLFAGAAPAVAETLTRSMEGLTSLIRVVAAFLPDISQFAAVEEIAQGSAIRSRSLTQPLAVLAMFGLPILALSYVFFRNKEVAP